ncbi:uncharacterized protein Z519_01027 [Cladophialophora bantiana CBS 173.52]|uniref:Xylanolytic transcriptional activator regulatory domain-containing protein n=1 Tax=Cladophialophora bantiana (strain ATCC 10958 / CBS 173.52 / CDC B-1940 / NIH 8579) TaxID=1442370 RepID=A0A0D2HVQ0_CLAB1|nr:uncharacterized protein Z519_01027 [Cladophialophora bantiana CBS 173.52]KIW97443.1 hypothetical protein Z519_01027 [Cladophialophora bantiana CBS 173.52]
MSVLPEQLARLFSLPVGRERLQNKIASSPVEILNNRKLANASITRLLIDCFFSCTGTLFYIFSPRDAAELFQSAYMDTAGATKASLGALCALASVASQYDDLEIDGSLRQSYYETAKFYLDECIEEDEVLGMRVLCCLAIYCAMDRRLTAWTWTLTGLKLARLRGLHLNRRPLSTSPEEWIAQRKVLRTLIVLGCWVASTLGINPQIMEAFQPGFHEPFAVLEDHPPFESVAQAQMTSICILTSGVLRDVFLPTELSLVATREYKIKIVDWLSKLPPIMQLESLMQDQDLTLVQRRCTFLVHLNYLGAQLLLYRRHSLYLSTVHRDDSWELDGDVAEALAYAKDALDAATQSSRIFAHLLSERATFKRSWLVIYQSFSACTMLLFHVAQKRLHGVSLAHCEEELSSAETCLTTLHFCSEGDIVAKGYYDMLIFYYRALKITPEHAPTGTAHGSAMQEDLELSSMDGPARLQGESTPDKIVEGVSNLSNHAFQHSRRDGMVPRPPPPPPPQISDSVRRWFPEFTTGPYLRLSRDTAIYQDAPVVGGPFQWSANSIPRP